jgi:hypothetical protein
MTTASASTAWTDQARLEGEQTMAAAMPRMTPADHALRALAAWLAATGLLPADAVKARKAAIDIVTG